MREVLFRGKQIYGGEWVQGNLVVALTGSFIVWQDDIHDPWQTNEVEPSTIGQFTGLTDENETKIFEGDICFDAYSEDQYQIEFIHGKFVANLDVSVEIELSEVNKDVEIIGNIHDGLENDE